MKPRSSSCELCGGPASLYCQSDSAFLCAGCDARVHGANFLAARHVRTPIASPCKPGDSRDDEDADDTDSSVRSEESSCISTAESAVFAACRPGGRPRPDRRRLLPRTMMTRRPSLKNSGTATPPRATAAETTGVDARTEGVLASWCAALGAGALGGGTTNCAAVVASHAMSVGLRRLVVVVRPRVCAAAAVWFAFKLCYGGRQGVNPVYGQYLRRLEECSGVPARIVAAAESKLSHLVRRRQVDAEGWAECGS